jgi:enoyl-CoA hydratase
METLVSYDRNGSVATVKMDDGKVNVLSPAMLDELNSALNQAEADQVVVILTGREGTFSAGLDLAILRGGGSEAVAMLRSGFELAERLLSFPTPVVIACNGNAIAMAAFLLLSGDYRVGTVGTYKIIANEVAIGLTMPRSAVEICRQRLTPAHFNRAVVLSEPYSPEEAVEAGFVDRVVDASELQEVAGGIAAQLAELSMSAHAATKLRARSLTLGAIRTSIEADDAELRSLFI